MWFYRQRLAPDWLPSVGSGSAAPFSGDPSTGEARVFRIINAAAKLCFAAA